MIYSSCHNHIHYSLVGIHYLCTKYDDLLNMFYMIYSYAPIGLDGQHCNQPNNTINCIVMLQWSSLDHCNITIQFIYFFWLVTMLVVMFFGYCFVIFHGIITHYGLTLLCLRFSWQNQVFISLGYNTLSQVS